MPKSYMTIALKGGNVVRITKTGDVREFFGKVQKLVQNGQDVCVWDDDSDEYIFIRGSEIVTVQASQYAPTNW